MRPRTLHWTTEHRPVIKTHVSPLLGIHSRCKLASKRSSADKTEKKQGRILENVSRSLPCNNSLSWGIQQFVEDSGSCTSQAHLDLCKSSSSTQFKAWIKLAPIIHFPHMEIRSAWWKSHLHAVWWALQHATRCFSWVGIHTRVYCGPTRQRERICRLRLFSHVSTGLCFQLDFFRVVQSSPYHNVEVCCVFI